MNILATTFDAHPTERQRYRNSLTGLAAGDAWGYQVEFRRFSRMPSYPVAAPAGTWKVSDDTQMAIAVNDALADLTSTDFDPDVLDPDVLADAFIDRYLDWYHDPDNTRAPGSTCMGSLRQVGAGNAWHSAQGAFVSRGCGAVMRVAPTAFADDEHWAGLAVLQAVITHKHPTAALSSLLVADAIRHSREQVGDYVQAALANAVAIVDGTHEWCSDPFLEMILHPVLERPGKESRTVQDYLIEGLFTGPRGKKSTSGPYMQHLAPGTLFAALLAANEVQLSYRCLNSQLLSAVDPCRKVGEGWDSATAAALALLVADMGTAGPFTPHSAIAWAATSNGDSDSIAAVAGAILGAMSDQEDFWELEGLTPTFEPRYARAIANAPAASMALGVYPPEAQAARLLYSLEDLSAVDDDWADDGDWEDDEDDRIEAPEDDERGNAFLYGDAVDLMHEGLYGDEFDESDLPTAPDAVPASLVDYIGVEQDDYLNQMQG